MPLLNRFRRRLLATARLREVVAHLGPSASLARVGGDEFAIVIDPLVSPEQFADLAASVLESVIPPITIDGFRNP